MLTEGQWSDMTIIQKHTNPWNEVLQLKSELLDRWGKRLSRIRHKIRQRADVQQYASSSRLTVIFRRVGEKIAANKTQKILKEEAI